MDDPFYPPPEPGDEEINRKSFGKDYPRMAFLCHLLPNPRWSFWLEGTGGPIQVEWYGPAEGGHPYIE